MAFIEIVALDNRPILISANSVSRVRPGRAAEGAAGQTSLDTGAAPHYSRMSIPSAARLLQDAGVTMIELTDGEGQQLFVNTNAITWIGYPQFGQDAPSTHTLLILGGQRQAVRETFQDIRRLLGMPD